MVINLDKMVIDLDKDEDEDEISDKNQNGPQNKPNLSLNENP